MVIERLVSEFERGRLTRRQLIARLTALMAVTTEVAAQETSPTFQSVGLNHIALRVTDVPRLRDFYVKHLGLEVTRQSSSNAFLSCGKQFVALFRSSTPGLDHYCYSVRDYSVQTAAEKLRSQNLRPRIAGNRIYFEDPDGLTVQLADPEHTA